SIGSKRSLLRVSELWILKSGSGIAGHLVGMLKTGKPVVGREPAPQSGKLRAMIAPRECGAQRLEQFASAQLRALTQGLDEGTVIGFGAQLGRRLEQARLDRPESISRRQLMERLDPVADLGTACDVIVDDG